MKRTVSSVIMAVLLNMAMLANPTYAEWILLGTYKGMTYEVNPVPVVAKEKEVGLLKNKVLSGDLSGYYVVQEFQFNCKDDLVRPFYRYIYNPENKLLHEEQLWQPWLEVEKYSFADEALNKFWCKNI
jgi:hypothetical protein